MMNHLFYNRCNSDHTSVLIEWSVFRDRQGNQILFCPGYVSDLSGEYVHVPHYFGKAPYQGQMLISRFIRDKCIEKICVNMNFNDRTIKVSDMPIDFRVPREFVRS